MECCSVSTGSGNSYAQGITRLQSNIALQACTLSTLVNTTVAICVITTGEKPTYGAALATAGIQEIPTCGRYNKILTDISLKDKGLGVLGPYIVCRKKQNE
jgi:hypothetical protein